MKPDEEISEERWKDLMDRKGKGDFGEEGRISCRSKNEDRDSLKKWILKMLFLCFFSSKLKTTRIALV